MKSDKEKQKGIIVAVLAVMVVGIGAYQFVGGGGSKPAPPKPAKPAPKVDDPNAPKPIKNPEFAMALPKRDPFQVPADEDTSNPQVTKAPVKQQPAHMSGRLPNDVLPPATGGGSVAPISVAPPEPVFAYRLSGLIVGHHPAAVFTDASGTQRLVPLGASLDGDSQLVAVMKGRAAVRFRGKRVWLTLGGTPDAN